MKNLILPIAIVLGISSNVFAQGKKESGIYFGAIAGTKLNDFNKHFNVNIDPQLYSFSIGAGSSWTKNKYVVGIEFLYSSAKNEDKLGEIQYVGFGNTLFFGYNISKSKTWKIEPNLGIVLNNNQLIVQDRTNTTFQNLINNQLNGNIGINIKTVGKNGLFTGVKLGYMLPFSGETEWENKVSGTKTGLKDNVDAFYLQLNLGGLLTL